MKLSECLIIDIATEKNNNDSGLLWVMSKDELFLQGLMCPEQGYMFLIVTFNCLVHVSTSVQLCDYGCS